MAGRPERAGIDEAMNFTSPRESVNAKIMALFALRMGVRLKSDVSV